MQRLEIEAAGGCQCGAIRYKTTAMLDNAHLCHCRMCQRAVGNIFAALVAAPRDALTWVRGEPSRFHSSEHVDRGFCSNCGTPLFYENTRGDRVNLTIGSLDHPDAFSPKTQMGTESRVAWWGDLLLVPDLGETSAVEPPAEVAAIAATNRQWQPPK